MVIRVLRGSNAEHIAALPADKPDRRKASPSFNDDGPALRQRGEPDARRPSYPTVEQPREIERQRGSVPKPEPKMRAEARPSRAKLEDPEKALGRTDADYRKMIAGIRKQERALQLKRRDLEKRHEDEIAKLETVIAKAREHYRAALEKWRS